LVKAAGNGKSGLTSRFFECGKQDVVKPSIGLGRQRECFFRLLFKTGGVASSGKITRWRGKEKRLFCLINDGDESDLRNIEERVA